MKKMRRETPRWSENTKLLPMEKRGSEHVAWLFSVFFCEFRGFGSTHKFQRYQIAVMDDSDPLHILRTKGRRLIIYSKPQGRRRIAPSGREPENQRNEKEEELPGKRRLLKNVDQN